MGWRESFTYGPDCNLQTMKYSLIKKLRKVPPKVRNGAIVHMGVRKGAQNWLLPPPLEIGTKYQTFWKTCSEHLIQINWLTSCNDSLFADISGAGRWGWKHTPKSFDVVKIQAKFLKIGKIRRNLWKPWQNPRKSGQTSWKHGKNGVQRDSKKLSPTCAGSH